MSQEQPVTDHQVFKTLLYGKQLLNNRMLRVSHHRLQYCQEHHHQHHGSTMKSTFPTWTRNRTSTSSRYFNFHRLNYLYAKQLLTNRMLRISLNHHQYCQQQHRQHNVKTTKLKLQTYCLKWTRNRPSTIVMTLHLMFRQYRYLILHKYNGIC